MMMNNLPRWKVGRENISGFFVQSKNPNETVLTYFNTDARTTRTGPVSRVPGQKGFSLQCESNLLLARTEQFVDVACVQRLEEEQ